MLVSQIGDWSLWAKRGDRKDIDFCAGRQIADMRKAINGQFEKAEQAQQDAKRRKTEAQEAEARAKATIDECDLKIRELQMARGELDNSLGIV